MRPATWRRLARRIAGALTLLLGIVAPQPSRAGCTHLDRHPDIGAVPTAQFELLGRAGALALPTGEAPLGPRTPRPCAGASCSDNLPRPFVPNGPEPFPRVRWAIRDGPSAPERVTCHAALCDEAGPRPVHRAFPVFHPPPLA